MNALMQQELDSIQGLLEAEETETLENARERFRVETLEQATWCLRKIAAIKAQANEVKAVAEAEIQRIQQWYEKETEKLQRSIDFFTSLLQEYHMQELSKDPKRKTISTPYGKLTVRKAPAKWEYNEERLLAWLKEQGLTHLIRVKEEPAKSDIKKAFQVAGNRVVDENGQLVEGITVIEQPDLFKVEVDA